jgi:hypothetical protein
MVSGLAMGVQHVQMINSIMHVGNKLCNGHAPPHTSIQIVAGIADLPPCTPFQDKHPFAE